MSSSGHSSSIVALRYANALIELAEEAKNAGKVEQDLKDLQAMMAESPEFLGAIRSPVINQDSLSKALAAIADKAKFQDVTKKFLQVLVANRRLNVLDRIAQAYAQLAAKRRGEVSVDVKVAHDLSDAQKKELQAALSKAMGAEVSVRATVEPAILGGMVVTVGSRMIDNSVRRKLERLRTAIGANANQNLNITSNSSNLSEVK